MPEALRKFDDIEAIRDQTLGNTVNALSELGEFSYGPYTVAITDVKAGKAPDLSYANHKKSLLARGSLGTPIWGTWNLKDEEGNEVEKRKKLLMYLPAISKHGTYVRKGVEYSLANQVRLRPGVFTHEKANGQLESHFNVAQGTGRQFRVQLDPENGRFHMLIRQAKVPLLPIMRALGADDESIKAMWGDEIFNNNAAKLRADDVKRAADRMEPFVDAADVRSPEDRIRDAATRSQLDPTITERTLGKAFSNVSAEALLMATTKLLGVHSGEVEPDDRDSLAFQRVVSHEDLFPERVRADAARSIRKVLYNITKKKSLDAVPAGAFNEMSDSVLLHSGLGQTVEETNLTEVADQLRRVTRLGRGAIGDIAAIPDSARAVQPSYAGFIDPVRSPECYDEDTQVFTVNGWNTWNEVDEGTLFACKIDGAMTFEKAKSIYHSQYEGDMYGVRTGKPTSSAAIVDFRVTPEHRIWTKPYDQSNLAWRFETAEAHFEKYGRKYQASHEPYAGTFCGHFELPSIDQGGNNQRDFGPIDMEDWCEFLGWYLSEGSHAWKPETFSYITVISQSREASPVNCQRLDDLMERLPFAATYSQKRYCMGGKQLASYMRQFGTCEDKFIPEEFFHVHAEARRRLMGALLWGDGRNSEGKYKGGPTFISTSKRLRDDFARLAIGLGFPVSYRIEADNREHVTTTNYAAAVLVHRERVALRKHHYKDIYKGEVHCATVPGGLLYVRRNGSHGLWLGNSAKVGVDNRFTHGVLKGKDGRLYREMLRPDGEPALVSAEDTLDATIAFPGEMDSESKKVSAISKGKLKRVDRGEVDYVLPSAASMFTLQTNLMPGVSATSGGRVFLGAKFISQSMPLKRREAPLVQSAHPEGGSYTQYLGKKIGAISSDVTGVVTKVDDNGVSVLTDEGENKTFDAAHYLPHNRRSYLKHMPQVQVGDRVTPGKVLASSNITDKDGTLAIGTNLRVAYVPFNRGDASTFEDAVVLSESGAKKLSAQEMFMHKLSPKVGKLNKGSHRAAFPGVFTASQLSKVGKDGLAIPGSTVEYGDPLLLAVQPRKGVKIGMGKTPTNRSHKDVSVLWEHETPGYVTDTAIGPQGAVVAVAAENPMHVGDKLSGRAADKGVVSAIIPDDRMPKDEAGNPFEVLVNPLGVISRGNPSQLIEAALGKLAEKQGAPVVLEGFGNDDFADKALQMIRKAGIKSKEDIFDPVLNRKIRGVTTGRRFYMRLHHLSEKKMSSRGAAEGYTAEGSPSKGGKNSAPRFGLMELNALASNNAHKVLQDSHKYRGHRNTDYWRAVMSGYAPPAPQQSDMVSKFMASLAAAGIHVDQDGSKLNIMAMTDKDVDELAMGEVTKAETVSFPDLKPIKGGLFDRALTGGHGGDKFAKIELGTRIPNPLMEDPIRKLLGLTQKKYRAVISGEEDIEGYSGPNALFNALAKINVDTHINDAKQQIKARRGPVRDQAVKRLRILDMLKTKGLKPSEMMISKVGVLPPTFRPISMMNDVPLVNDANALYKDLLTARDNLGALQKELGPGNTGEERLAVYDTVKAVIGLGDPVGKESKERGVSGILKQIFGKGGPKTGMFQRKMMGTTVDLGGRGVITPDPRLNMDQVAIPEDSLWRSYRPFVMRRLTRSGYSPMAAAIAVKEKTPQAKQALLMETKSRPVMLNRAPSLHRFSIMGAWPVMTKSRTIRVSPQVVSSFNADFDGDQQINKVFAVVSDVVYHADSAYNTGIGLQHKEIPMPAYMQTTIVGINPDDHLLLVDLEDFPHLEEHVTKGHIDFHPAAPGFRVIALDEKTGRLAATLVSGWSVHRDRPVEIVTLGSKKQIITDDDPRAVYGLDGETLEWCRRRPSEARNVFVPVSDKVEALPETLASVRLPESERLKQSADLTRDFGHLLGVIVGDGWASQSRGKYKAVCLAASDSDIGHAFSSEIAVCFVDRPIVNFSDVGMGGKFENSSGCDRYTVCCGPLGKTVADWVGSGAAYKHLPDFTWAAPRKFKLGLLAGLIDTDGSISQSRAKSKPQWLINYSTNSIRLAQELQQLLRTFGVTATITAADTPAGGDTWVVNISTPEAHEHLRDLRLASTSKRGRLEEFLAAPAPDRLGAYSRYRLMPMPAWLANELTKLITNKMDHRTYSAIKMGRAKGHISKELAVRVLKILGGLDRTCEHPAFPRWRAVVEQDGYHFERVVDVEVTGVEETGYDLTVPGCETFMSLDGIVLSNTMAFHVPASDEARDEVISKMMPSRQLLGLTNFKSQFRPRQEFQLGLWAATKPSKDKLVKQFESAAAALSAFKRGELNLDSTIEIPGAAPKAGLIPALMEGLV